MRESGIYGCDRPRPLANAPLHAAALFMAFTSEFSLGVSSRSPPGKIVWAHQGLGDDPGI